MVILFPYDTDDLSTLAPAKVMGGLSTPILKNYDYLPLAVRKIPARKRITVLREYIDRTDFLGLVTGTYTFMRPWCHFAMVYAISKNQPLMDIDTTFISDGWDNELTSGPNAFKRVRYVIEQSMVNFYVVDSFLEVVWRKRLSLPRKQVKYRFYGKSGFMDEVAPRHEWTADRADRYFPDWVKESIYLSGITALH